MKNFIRLTGILLFACASDLSAQTTLGTSLTACYPLNGAGTEAVNNLTGTLSAVTATLDRFNNAGSAIAFNGTASSYIELPGSPLLKPDAISLSCWVKLDDIQDSQIIVYTHNGCATYWEGYQLAYSRMGNLSRFEVAKSNFMCSPQGQTVIYSATSTVQAQTWYHVGFYNDADSVKLYVNGTLEAWTIIPQPLVYSPSAGVILGGTNSSPNLPFSGVLDNLRFYNRKLSGVEMMQLYTQDPQCLSGLLPVTSFTAPAVVCRNQMFSLNDQSTNGPVSWSWQINGGSPATSTLSSPVVSFSVAGVYTVSLTTSNAFGAGNTATQTISVSLCTAEEELDRPDLLRVFPNPARGYFTIEPGVKRPITVVVVDPFGRKLLELDHGTGIDLQVDLSRYPAGLYLLLSPELNLWRKVMIE